MRFKEHLIRMKTWESVQYPDGKISSEAVAWDTAGQSANIETNV